MAVKDALLALLADGPRHGYHLKSAFDEATGSAWPLNIGQVYTTLQRLERDELVAADGAPDEDGRQQYLLTAAGRLALDAWMSTPYGSPVTSRDEVSMKVLIALATGVTPALEVVRTQRISAMETLQALSAMKPEAATRGLAWQLHLDRTVLLAESEVRWLDLVEQRLEASGASTRASSRNGSSSTKKTSTHKSRTNGNEEPGGSRRRTSRRARKDT